MKLHTVVVGALATNCYILEDEDTKEAVIVDPGEEPKRIIAEVESLGVQVLYIMITHGHMDHIRGAADLAETYQCPVLMHAGEIAYMKSDIVKRSPYSEKAFNRFFEYAEQGKFVKHGDQIGIGSMKFRVIEVPGHTSHSICFYEENSGAIWVGDTLFAGGVGRTDFYEGDPWELLVYIQQRLMVLPDAVQVWPGHGPGTTIGQERQWNPYLNMLR